MTKDSSEEFKKRVALYSEENLIFTKKNPELLFRRINSSEKEVKEDLLNPVKLVFTQKQEVEFNGTKETRYACYYIYSNSRGRCYIVGFNHEIKVITAFPLGRKTINKYRKRFKWRK